VCKVEQWVLKKHSFFSSQDKTGIFVSFVFTRDFYFMSSDTKDIFPHVLGH
jgi:hypothetical protein